MFNNKCFNINLIIVLKAGEQDLYYLLNTIQNTFTRKIGISKTFPFNTITFYVF